MSVGGPHEDSNTCVSVAAPCSSAGDPFLCITSELQRTDVLLLMNAAVFIVTCLGVSQAGRRIIL